MGAHDIDLASRHVGRTPKLFLVSTSTSTFSTTTFCWATAPSTAATDKVAEQCRRRKRTPAKEFPSAEIIVTRPEERESSNDVDSDEAEWQKNTDDMDVDVDARAGRGFLYWMTTTTTAIVYTATASIQKVKCTPAGFTMNNCKNLG